METRDIRLTVLFKAKPHEVYEALMDSKKHAAFSDSEAKISRQAGGKFTAYDGYITGKNVELIIDRKIVQSWRGSDWPEGYYSRVTFDLEPTAGGTRLLFVHEGVPVEFYDDIKQGWTDFYWKPMKRFLGK
jgi:activator of HSP90 ATPase